MEKEKLFYEIKYQGCGEFLLQKGEELILRSKKKFIKKIFGLLEVEKRLNAKAKKWRDSGKLNGHRTARIILPDFFKKDQDNIFGEVKIMPGLACLKTNSNEDLLGKDLKKSFKKAFEIFEIPFVVKIDDEHTFIVVGEDKGGNIIIFEKVGTYGSFLLKKFEDVLRFYPNRKISIYGKKKKFGISKNQLFDSLIN